MAKITIENLFGKILQADTQKTLLQNFQEHQIDWMHACGGKGRCTTCRVVITKGMENLKALTTAELRFRLQHGLGEAERLTCQAMIAGDVTVFIPSDCQLPHMNYGTSTP
jgi:ferredoxin, 2Fe-2S